MADDTTKPVPQMKDFTDQQVMDQIEQYLAGKDLGRTPMFKACQDLFPGQLMTIRFERLFGLVVDPPKPAESSSSSSSSSMDPNESSSSSSSSSS